MNGKAEALSILVQHSAPMPVSRRIVDAMADAGLFTSGEERLEAITALATEFEGSKSPAIRSAGKKLRAVLNEGTSEHR